MFLQDVRVSLYNKEALKDLCCESELVGIVDGGCTKSVCGEGWLTKYLLYLYGQDIISSPNPNELSSCQSGTSFLFGGGEQAQSYMTVGLPFFVDGNMTELSVDVIHGSLPLLIGKSTLRDELQASEDHANYTIEIAGVGRVQLTELSTGHAGLPLAVSTM